MCKDSNIFLNFKRNSKQNAEILNICILQIAEILNEQLLENAEILVLSFRCYFFASCVTLVAARRVAVTIPTATIQAKTD